MATRLVGRVTEFRAVTNLLDAAAESTAGLLIEGEAGIGKSTLIHAAIDEGRDRGFHVLAGQSAGAESVLAYAVLADLLRRLPEAVFEGLPDVQRQALDRVLMRADERGRATDQREVAAGFLTVVERLVSESPVLIVIDDMQWLDASSRKVIAYAARRFTGRTGFLGAVRIEASGDTVAWLQMVPPDSLTRISLSPMNLGNLHALLSERFGRTIRRPAMVRIRDISGGNPFYALELARTLDDDMPVTDMHLPGNLTELVRARIGGLGSEVRELLLCAACMAEPTVELLALATDTDVDDIFDFLAQAEHDGIIRLEGHRVRFEHPLLARGVYADFATARRRVMHRRLAEIIEQPELRARHLALSSSHGDPHMLDSLDAGAEIARIRGAPVTAAELLDLAIELGGDTHERRLRSARHHFNAGDAARARALLSDCVERRGTDAAEALTLMGLMEILEGSLSEAAVLLERALEESGTNLPLRVQILVPLSLALFNGGQRDAASARIDEAVSTASPSADAHVLSEALSMQTLLRCWLGRGVEWGALQRALELENRNTVTSMLTAPGMHNAMLLAFAGRLDEAHHAMREMNEMCSTRGDESEQVFVAFHWALLEIWRGDFDAAAAIANDAMECARLLDGDLPRGAALTIRAALAAYVGRYDTARRDANRAARAIQPAGSRLLAAWPVMVLGFVEVSLGDYAAAVATLAPLLVTFDPEATEIFSAAYLPDIIEALIALDRLDEAQPLLAALESNGRRLDRPWMLAVGGRCRAMLLAAQGEIATGLACAMEAMAHHDRLPMPFERARTQLLLGQLQRRQRKKSDSAATLGEAMRIFEDMPAALWAERTRAELARSDVAHLGTDELTPSEQRVAELAASGMSNRDIAAAMFISPKTVESNLARVYRKLDIHSRGQLSRHVTPRDP